MTFRNFKKAVVLLMRYPNNVWLNFLHNFKHYDVYVFIDDNSKDFKQLFKNVNKKINFIQIDDNFCKYRGYYNSVIKTDNVPYKVLSWDKALFYFCWMNNIYEHVWFVEDDVFFSNEEIILKIDDAHKDSDLLVSEHTIHYGTDKSSEPQWEHWHCAWGKTDPPWAKSMACMCRLSNKLLKKVKEFVNSNGKSEFIEFIFNTLAMHHNLKIDTPVELSKIYYRNDWGTNIDLKYCYHPFKNINDHITIRQNHKINCVDVFGNIDYDSAKKFNFHEFQFYIDNLPDGFDFNVYYEKYSKSLIDNTTGSMAWDWFYNGQYLNRIYKIEK
jgi:hypothetical protein